MILALRQPELVLPKRFQYDGALVAPRQRRLILPKRFQRGGMLVNPYVGASSTIPEAEAFYGGLVAYWEFTENAASPTYSDSHGSNDLTLRVGASTANTSTQTSTTSKPSGGRAWFPNRLDNSACVIPRANTALDMTTDAIHTIGGWFKTNLTAGTTAFVIGRVGSAFAKLHFWIFVDPADNIIKARYSADNTTAAVTVSSTVAVDATEWQLIIASYNRTAGTLTIRVRKETTGGLASQSAALGAAITSTSNNCNFTIGEGFENDTSFDGSNNRTAVVTCDSAFYTQAAMSDAIFNYLFNGNAGKTYAQIEADAT